MKKSVLLAYRHFTQTTTHLPIHTLTETQTILAAMRGALHLLRRGENILYSELAIPDQIGDVTGRISENNKKVLEKKKKKKERLQKNRQTFAEQTRPKRKKENA